MSSNSNYKVISVIEDICNLNAEFELENNLKFSPNLINSILFEATVMIHNNSIYQTFLQLSYYSHYISDELEVKSNILLEADILKHTNENLIAECYLYEKYTNKFIAKSFLVYKKEL